MNLSDDSNFVATTYLCGSIDNQSCSTLHPSCSGGTDDICSGCKDTAVLLPDNAACVCDEGKGHTVFSSFSCNLCHSSCKTCYQNSPNLSADMCLSCSDPGADLLYHTRQSPCACRAGFVYKLNPYPTNACELCKPSGCPYCIGYTADDCMPEAEGKFVKRFKSTLPYLTKTADNMFCYREQYPTTTCTPHQLSAIIGSFEPPSVSLNQCYKLLTEQWPRVIESFTNLFPLFKGPPHSDTETLDTIRGTLYLWILQFGEAEMKTWNDIKNAMTAEGDQWYKYEAWAGPTPGFTLDGETTKPFPPNLSIWLAGYCTTSSGCVEIQNAFSIKSTLCANSLCSQQAKDICEKAKPGTACATRTFP